MSLAPQALVRGLVQRALPSINTDSTNSDVAQRLATYGEIFTQPLIRRDHNLADEGTYFTVGNAQTAITRPIVTSFTATSPWMLVVNNSLTQRLYLLYAAITTITATTAASAAAWTAFAAVIDSVNRFSSGGTNVTANVISPNMLVANTGLVSVYFAPTATAAVAPRAISPFRILRPAASATALSVVGDMSLMTFGSVEGNTGNPIATASMTPQALPPVIIGPTQSALLYTWLSATTPAAGTDALELGFLLR